MKKIIDDFYSVCLLGERKGRVGYIRCMGATIINTPKIQMRSTFWVYQGFLGHLNYITCEGILNHHHFGCGRYFLSWPFGRKDYLQTILLGVTNGVRRVFIS